jgi:hypothetical protein
MAVARRRCAEQSRDTDIVGRGAGSMAAFPWQRRWSSSSLASSSFFLLPALSSFSSPIPHSSVLAAVAADGERKG